MLYLPRFLHIQTGLDQVNRIILFKMRHFRRRELPVLGDEDLVVVGVVPLTKGISNTAFSLGFLFLQKQNIRMQHPRMKSPATDPPTAPAMTLTLVVVVVVEFPVPDGDGNGLSVSVLLLFSRLGFPVTLTVSHNQWSITT